MTDNRRSEMPNVEGLGSVGRRIVENDRLAFAFVRTSVHILLVEDFGQKAVRYGMKDWILDPGFGFAKTVEQNYALLNGLNEITAGMGHRKVLVGVSRKSMIYRLLGTTPEESLPATQALHMAALERGADILRVHDVAEAVHTSTLFKMLS